MSSLKRLDAQGASIPTGSQPKEGMEAEGKGAVWYDWNMRFSSCSQGCFSALNSSKKSLRTNSGFNVLYEVMSCPLLQGTGIFLPRRMLLYLTHHNYRLLPGHRASSEKDLAKDTGGRLLLVHLIKSTSVL